MSEMLSLVRADFAVNDTFGKLTTLAYRVRHLRARSGRFAGVVLLLPALIGWCWCELVMGATIPSALEAGAGLRLPHGGRGVVLHPSVVLGRDVTLYHRVTIGIRGGGARAAELGDRAYVGAGAAVLGAVRIGEGAKIGANAVVVRDVPAGATARAPLAEIVPFSRD